MIDRNEPVREEDLHAYVDGELDAERRDVVAAWLATHPEAAAQVAGWREQADAIRARYGAIAQEPIPARLKLDALLRRQRSWVSAAAAASIAAFAIGGGLGWYARGAAASTATAGVDKVATDAVEAYRLYTVEVRHPVEVAGDERAHMTQWLTKRLGYQQHIPDLSSIGLKLVGGRLLPGPDGAAAFYMYEGPSGERFTIYCSRTDVAETSMRFKDTGRVATFYWVDNKQAYVVSGPANRDRVEQVTKAIYEQVDKAMSRKS
jgi:anti-sigma factor RsiW